MAKKSKQLTEVERVGMLISEAEQFIENHKGVKSWDELPDDDLLDWDSRIMSGLDFSYRKGYQQSPVLRALKKRHDAVMEWNASLGGFDE